MMVSENAKRILFDPLRKGADHIFILSGYAAPTMLSWYITNLQKRTDKQVKISLIVGMIPYNGISTAVHEGFVDIVKGELPWEVNKVECSYICDYPAVHANLYIWTSAGTPITAFTGSADFVQRSFVGSQCKDIVVDYDPSQAMDFYRSVTERTIYATHSEIEEYVTIRNNHPILDSENINNEAVSENEAVHISLLTKKGYPGTRSGLNWGQRKGRNPNQAYIPLSQSIARSGFFPLEQKHFFVMTDDKKNLIMRVEQQNNKAITTPSNNSLLGEYFRNRLGLANGAFVRREDLINYGRTDVVFIKIDDETYYMDFSPQNSQK